jgi:hypothetical protein
MSRLGRRIASVGGNQESAMGRYHPAGTADTPMVMPLVLVEVGPQTSAGISTGEPGWNYARVQEMTPLIGPKGEPIPATAPRRWAQVFEAGIMTGR